MYTCVLTVVIASRSPSAGVTCEITAAALSHAGARASTQRMALDPLSFFWASVDVGPHVNDSYHCFFFEPLQVFFIF
jgi:hypothetical protein